MGDYGNLDREGKLKLYWIMSLSRHFELKVNELFMKGQIHGTTHLGIGQEANHAGLSQALAADDWIAPTHRGHGHFIGKGGSMRSMMAELMGLSSGACKGLGGSMHLLDIEHHNAGSSGVVGGSVPMTVGMAYALKRQGSSQIVACCLGDGAMNQGMTLESLNLASVLEVPLLFYCENNQYAMSSAYSRFVGGQDIPARAQAFGVEALQIDGNNVGEVFDAVRAASSYVRGSGRPALIESVTYRQLGHSKSDQRKYRTPEEEEAWKAKCPILANGKLLVDTGVASRGELDALEAKAAGEVEAAVVACQEGPQDFTSVQEALGFVD